MTRRALTLVELLVATSVVALLIGVLAPSLAGAMDAAQAARCAAGLRELQHANLAHAADRRGEFVAGAPGIRTSNTRRWHGVRESSSGVFDPADAPLSRYLGNGGTSESLRECPTFSGTLHALADSGEGFERGCGGYGYNNAFVGVQRKQAGSRWIIVDDARGALLDRFDTPAATLAFADAAFAANDGLIEYSFVEPRFWPDSPSFRPDPSIHFRHASKAQVVWLDGHVSSESRTFTHRSGLYRADPAQLGIGWFGASDDNDLFDYD